jgi:hypothetical protein
MEKSVRESLCNDSSSSDELNSECESDKQISKYYSQIFVKRRNNPDYLAQKEAKELNNRTVFVNDVRL